MRGDRKGVRARVAEAARRWPANPYHRALRPDVQGAVEAYVKDGNPAHLDGTAFRMVRDAAVEGEPEPTCCEGGDHDNNEEDE